MENVHKLKKQKESDRRTALLGLAASASSGKKTDCLSSEQMAALVAGNCSAKEQQRFFEHLAACERCYGQWVELHAIEGKEQKRQDKIIGIRSFKINKLAWAGSALAVAASVVLYLNIVRDAGQPLYKSQAREESRMESAGALQSSRAPGEGKTGRADVEQVEKPLQVPTAPVSKRSKQAVQSRKAKRQAAGGEVGLSSSADQDVIMMEAAPLGEEGAAFQMQSAPAPAKLPLSLDFWLKTVGQACLDKEQDVGFWQQQYAAGSTLLQEKKRMTPGFAEEQQGRKLAEVLNVVQRLGRGDRAGDLCRKIEEILE